MSTERSSIEHDTVHVADEAATARQRPDVRPRLSLDSWAVLAALAAAALVKLHILNTVKW